jgi:hypothetical protein
MGERLRKCEEKIDVATSLLPVKKACVDGFFLVDEL